MTSIEKITIGGIEQALPSSKCPVYGRLSQTDERLLMGNDSPARHKHKIYYKLHMCDG